MFVEGKIPVDRHLRFHCFRPFSSDYEARKLKFFESCKTGLNFAEVDKKSAKKKIFFCLQLKSSVTACFFLMMSQWECRTWHCCCWVRINKGSHVTPVDFCTWLLRSNSAWKNKIWGTTILDTPHKFTQLERRWKYMFWTNTPSI